MKVYLGIALSLLFCSTFSQNIDSTYLLDCLREFSSDQYQGRYTGTKGNEMGRAFIEQEFTRQDVEPINDQYQEPFNFAAPMLKKSMTGVNVYGMIPGTDHPNKYIVISSHHDHMGTKDSLIYNGADDNGTGTCALLSLARYFKDNPPKLSIILVAFDAEEWGLFGSVAFVDKPPVERSNILLNINLDMIGRNASDELYISGTKFNKQYKKVFAPLIKECPLTIKYGHDSGAGASNWTYSSDHGSFHKKGIPFVYFGEEDHEDYHEPTDVFEKIDPSFYVASVKLILNSSLALEKHLIETKL